MSYLDDPVLFPGGSARANQEPDEIPVPAAITPPESPMPWEVTEEKPGINELPTRPISAELDAVLSAWLLKIDDDVSAARDALLLAGNRFTEDAQVQLDAAVTMAKVELRGAMLEALEEAGYQAGENMVKLLALELGGFAEKIEQNTNEMLSATKRMHETASNGPAIPSRFLWFVTGGAAVWLVTNYIDLARWSAIGQSVINSVKGAL